MASLALNAVTKIAKIIKVIELEIEPIGVESFAAFGTLVEAMDDGKRFGPDEAQLDLARGTPRFYVMKLARREPSFSHITRHLQVTQCLASVGGRAWLIAVAPPNAIDDAEAKPDPAAIRAFAVPGDKAIVLHRGTWHAGPFFEESTAAFFNLELTDTNQVDHHNCNLEREFGLGFRFKL